MNLAVHTGNLVRDPELRYTPGGTAICNITIAMSESYKNAAGERCEKSHFFNWMAWGKQGESIAQFFHKGKGIKLQGRSALEQWETKEGDKRSAVKFVVEKWEFDGPKTEAPAPGSKDVGHSQQAAPFAEDINEEEIPF